MDSSTLDTGLRVSAVASAALGTGLILFTGPALTVLGVVLVILGLVALIPAVGLSIDEWKTTQGS
ncbi:MAG: hypothetical protein ABEJ05_11040 [Haloglomus sp.]